MTPLLLDANLSPETTAFLSTTFGLDVVDLASLGFGALDDDGVVALAKRSGRVLLTFDLDFGRLYRREGGAIGVVVLRLDDQTVESVNRALNRFFRDDVPQLDLANSLVILDESRSRVSRYQD